MVRSRELGGLGAGGLFLSPSSWFSLTATLPVREEEKWILLSTALSQTDRRKKRECVLSLRRKEQVIILLALPYSYINMPDSKTCLSYPASARGYVNHILLLFQAIFSF